MYDAVTAANIPGDALMVAGYIDRIVLAPWTDADWMRFPRAVKVEIVKKASSNRGHVLDVEPGDARPDEAPGWVRMRRAAGADPTVYCSWSAWPTVRAAFAAAGVAEPHWWIARYDNDPTIPAGAVAKQYRGDVAPGFDVSAVADYWPGVDPAPGGNGSPTEQGEDEDMMRVDCKAIPSNGFATLDLAGGDDARITIYPGRQPVWIGDVFWWGEGHVPGDNTTGGLGNNPSPGPDALRVSAITTFRCPKALLAEVNFSSNTDFHIVARG
ncbi:hypothetical protein H480_38505 [Amycolatopsis vancoresmycina DSM 44592]|uniref:Uncharacterized protein n=2 Tax=Amycolatopsis vancoresmycina TaxID=208444 RepID=R1HS41_9PSEU|nr:hypothetical protein H480_38505 [Amycolatopsis vancoresmycina DSM 44592]